MRKMMGLTENYDIDSHYEDSVMGDVPGEIVEPEEDYDDLIEFDIPDWAVSALINGDYSGLSDEEESELNAFVDRVVEKYGNAHFMVDDYEKSHLGFLTRNDINSLGGDCTLLKIRPSSMDESGFQGEPNFQLPAEGGAMAAKAQFKKDLQDDPDYKDFKDKAIVPGKNGGIEYSYGTVNPDNDPFINKTTQDDIDESGFQGEPDFQLPAEGGDGVLGEEGMDMSLSMAVMSHLSDLQEQAPELRGKINFIKSLVMKMDCKTKISTDELDSLYTKYNDA